MILFPLSWIISSFQEAQAGEAEQPHLCIENSVLRTVFSSCRLLWILQCQSPLGYMVSPKLASSFWIHIFLQGSLASSTPLLWTWPFPSSCFLSSRRCLSTWSISRASVRDFGNPQLDEGPSSTAAVLALLRDSLAKKELFHRPFLLASNCTWWICLS